LFNASNTSGTPASKNRSDDKGPEPEGVATAFINGNHYLFVSLERVGGVMAFNVDSPAAPVYAGYFNNRSVALNGPDRGAEGIIYISKEASPNNEELLILANEISSTLSVFEVNSCVELSGAEIVAAADSICDGTTTTLSIAGHPQSSVQWFRNGAEMTETGDTITASLAGDYRVFVSNTAFACADTTVAVTITVNPLPVVSAGSDQSVCAGTSVTLSGSGALAYTWDNGVNDAQAFTADTTTTYTVTGTDANGCTNTDDVLVTINNLPAVSAGSDQAVCAGETVTLTASGAQTYAWDNNVTNGVAFVPDTTQLYVVTGTDTNNCQMTDTIAVTVNDLPAVTAGNDIDVCEGSSVTLGGSGADTYQWNNGVANGIAFIPAGTQTYTLTGTDTNGCEANDEVTVTVMPVPVFDIGPDTTTCANYGPVVLDAGAGFDAYLWNNNAVTQTISVSASGTYGVTVTGANGCTRSDAIVVTVDPCLGIEEQAIEMKLFPNPTSDLVTVQSTAAGPITVRVMTVSGEELFSGSNAVIDLSGLPSGTYVIQVTQSAIQRFFRVEKIN
jgi:hypothetical protein